MKIGTLTPMLMTATLAAGLTLGLTRLAAPAPSRASAAQDPPATLRATRFDLVDAQGRVRGGMAINAAGSPVVALLDETGRVRINMTQNAEGEFGFGVFDASGTPRFLVGTNTRGFVGLNVRDGAGRLRANLFATDDGTDVGFQVWDEDARLRAKLGLFPARGDYGVAILGADGQPIWQAP